MNPTFDAVFAVIAAAAVGDREARVPLPETLQLDDPATDLAVGVNVLLDDMAFRAQVSLRQVEAREQMADRLRVTSEVLLDLSKEVPNYHQLLEVLAQRLGAVIGDFCAVRMVADDGEWMDNHPAVFHPDRAQGDAMRRALAVPQRLGEGIMGRVAASGAAARYPMVGTSDFTPATRELMSHVGVTCMIVAPIASQGRVLGAITMGRPSGDGYTEDDMSLLGDIATQAGLVIANSRLVAEVRQSESRFAGLAESGLLGVLVMNPGGAIVDANDTFLRMLGYDRADLAAGRLSGAALTPPEWAKVDQEVAAQVARSGVSRPLEKRYLRKDGGRVAVLLGAALLADGDCMSFAADLTGQRSVEKALVATQEQLRQSQKMEAIGRLAGGVAHDFNNVLSVILSLADLLLRELGADAPMRADIEEIHKAGLRAADLTRQLLLFSRQQAMDARVIDANGLLSGMKRMLCRLVGEDVELTFTSSATPTRILVDPGQFEQVVMNLVVNARDAMPTGGKISVEVTEVEVDQAFATAHNGITAGPHVMLAVSDTGVGMSPETQERAFDPFFTTKPPGFGTGLGLSTVFGIVKQAHGGVSVSSEPGKGTTFKIYLPTAAPAVAPGRATLPPANLCGTETILLVEDDDQLRVVARTMLQRFGYRVIEAGGPLRALAIAERRGHEIDLLLTDVVMPDMSGPELARKVAAIRPGVRVLCMSGYTDEAVVRHGLVGSGIAFIQKPITPERLTRKVREVLDAANGASSPRV